MSAFAGTRPRWGAESGIALDRRFGSQSVGATLHSSEATVNRQIPASGSRGRPMMSRGLRPRDSVLRARNRSLTFAAPVPSRERQRAVSRMNLNPAVGHRPGPFDVCRQKVPTAPQITLWVTTTFSASRCGNRRWPLFAAATAGFYDEARYLAVEDRAVRR
jgi:hypothetical protein